MNKYNEWFTVGTMLISSPYTIFLPEGRTYIPLHIFHFTDEETKNGSERLSNFVQDTLSILNKIFA